MRIDGGGAPVGVILAGGQASRMGGGDKGLLRLNGGTVLDHVIARLSPQVETLALNANGDAARFAHFGLPVLPDSIADHPGPLAGVLAGLDWAAGLGARVIVTVAADTPFLPCDLVPRLLLAAEGMDPPLVLAATPRGDEVTRSMTGTGLVRHPTAGLWPVALRTRLRADLEGGLRKVGQWADLHHAREAVFADAKGAHAPFFNINTPEDLAAARAMLAGRSDQPG